MSLPSSQADEWTLVSRIRTRLRGHGPPSTQKSHDHFPAASPPDPGTTLATLRQCHARAQLWAEHDASARALRSQIESCASRLVPLDSVVLVALGSLSSDAVASGPSGNSGQGVKGSKGRKKGRRDVFTTGPLSMTSMRQLVVIEGLIGVLAKGGHAVKVPSCEGEKEESAEGMTKETEGGPEEEIKAVFTVPGTWPDRGRLLVQDPRLNAMDALFLAERGWTVLPSEQWACEPEPERKSEERDERQRRESSSALHSASPASSGSHDTHLLPSSPSPSSSIRVRASHAASHLHSSCLFMAPHAPHSLVLQSLLGAERSSHGKGGVGLYIGNAIDEGFATEKHARDSKEEEEKMKDWMGRRERLGLIGGGGGGGGGGVGGEGKAWRGGGGTGALELHGLQVWASLRTEEDRMTDEGEDGK